MQTSINCTILNHQCHCSWDCEENNRDRWRLKKRVAFSRSCSWEHTKCDKSWKKFEMNSAFFIMSTLINKKLYAHTLYDTKCLFYEMITFCFAKNHNLQCMKIRSHMITEFNKSLNSSVNEVVVIQIDIDEHQKSRAFFYIVFKIAFYDLILSLSWMTVIQNKKASAEDKFNYIMMLTMFFSNLIWKKEEKQKKIEMFLTSMINIKKALTLQKKTDLRTILLSHYYKFLNVFDYTMTEKLSFLKKEDCYKLNSY